jgi:hypothetical protein
MILFYSVTTLLGKERNRYHLLGKYTEAATTTTTKLGVSRFLIGNYLQKESLVFH